MSVITACEICGMSVDASVCANRSALFSSRSDSFSVTLSVSDEKADAV